MHTRHTKPMPQTVVDTQFGRLAITQDGDAITRVTWGDVDEISTTALLSEAVQQLEAYNAGELTAFDLPLHVTGHDLQRAVCDAMVAIPFGETRTYGDIAKEVKASPQAVGQACGGNPIPVIIPCHRVMGAGGKLVGFSGAGGVETKVALLRHEKAGGLLI